ncbi:MAG: Ig-like domain-containing protein [Chitinophagaceae bacterium]
MKGIFSGIFYCLLILLAGSCANIVPPSGGPKDVTPPKLISISPADSQLNTGVNKIMLRFDEYITLTDAATQVQISPLLSIPLTTTSQLKTVKISIPDTLLEPQTTYRISFGNAIRDLHEGNIYHAPSYTFSTGNYFDSLSLNGSVINSSLGLPDTTAFVLLYNAKESDSAIVQHKPAYVTHANGLGLFSFKGLPARAFRIYALRDANANLTFDGSGEWIGFADSTVTPGSDSLGTIRLYTFPEVINAADTAKPGEQGVSNRFNSRKGPDFSVGVHPGSYHVTVDTADAKRRTQDITEPLEIIVGRKLKDGLHKEHIFLSADSSGMTVEMPYKIETDSNLLNYKLKVNWLENTLYTLRLQKGFAIDSNGSDLLPGRYTFRTKRDEDYGKLRVHLPTKYFGKGFIFQVSTPTDTVYQAPVMDSLVNLLRLAPGTYTLRIIEDKNENGRWDVGNLFLKIQPEKVIPYGNTINLKAGWEQQIDFEESKNKRKDTDFFK